MNATYIRHDRLALVQVGERRLAVLLSDITSYAPAAEQRTVSDAPPWMTGALPGRAAGAWLPVIDLARLWDDRSLDGPWSYLVVAECGVAVGIGGFAPTQGTAPIVPLRPAPGNPALRWAAIVDGQAVPVLDMAELLPASDE